MRSLKRLPLVSVTLMSCIAALVLLSGVADVRADDDKKPSFNQLSRDLEKAYWSKDYSKALKIAEKMHELNPDHVATMYNMACLHCLLNKKDDAYTWLEKAVQAGYKDADHLLDDDDFKTIRAEDRFRGIVRRIRAGTDSGKKGKKESAEPRRPGRPKKPEKAKKAKQPKDEARTGKIKLPDLSRDEHGQKVNELTRKLINISGPDNREEALMIALTALAHAEVYHEAEGRGSRAAMSITHYNAACMYSLIKEKDLAFMHLNKSVDFGGFGGVLVDQIEDDEDFENIRKDERYAKVVERAKKVQQPRRRPPPSNDPPERKEAKFEWKVTLPEDHDKSKKAPLVVVLHHYNGSMDITAKRWMKAASKVDAILLTPQGTIEMGEGKFQWGRELDKIEENVMRAIDKAMDKHKIDDSKIVLAGFSQGGWATWSLAMRNPDTFCGIIPVAGSFKPESESAFDDDDLEDLCVFIMIGEEDNSAVLDGNKKAAKKLRKVGCEVRLNVYEELAHDYPDNETEELIKALEFVLAG